MEVPVLETLPDEPDFGWPYDPASGGPEPEAGTDESEEYEALKPWFRIRDRLMFHTDSGDGAQLVRAPIDGMRALREGFGEAMDEVHTLEKLHCYTWDQAKNTDVSSAYVGDDTDGWVRVRALPTLSEYGSYYVWLRQRFGYGWHRYKLRPVGNAWTVEKGI